MNPQQTELVRQSWAHAKPMAETIVRLFYRRLFEFEPQLRERFCTSMSEQGDHLLAATKDLVRDLANDPAEPPIGLVRKEEAFDRQSDRVATAWLWALGEAIGRRAAPAAGDAWREAIRSDRGATFRLVALGEVALVSV